MTILVDTQHGAGHSGDLAPALRRLVVPQSLVEEVHIEYGDVAFAGNGSAGRIVRIGVEIKKVGDVLRCIEDGRFAGSGGQLEGLHRDYDVCWLLIEEDLRPDPSTGVLMRRLVQSTVSGRIGSSARRGQRSRNQGAGVRWVPALFGAKRSMKYGDLMEWLTSIQILSQAQYGKPLYVWRTADQAETARWVYAQYIWWQKKWEAHKSLSTFNSAGWNQGAAAGRRKPIGFTSEHRRFRATLAATFDGVGFDRAMNLANRFSSASDMLNATPAELVTAASVVAGKRAGNGISLKLAQKMWEQFRRKGR